MYSTGMKGLRDAAKRIAIICTLSLAACGGGGESAGAGTGQAVGREYFPMSVGDRWVYHEWGEDRTAAPTTTLVKAARSSVMQGRTAIALESIDINSGQVIDTQYLAVSESAVTELLDGTQPVLGSAIDLLRFPLTIGQSFVPIDRTVEASDDLDGDQRRESFRVAATVSVLALESVQTDAGPFANAVHVRTVITQSTVFSSGSPSFSQVYTVDEWYAAGIGLVRQDYALTSPNNAFGFSGRTLLAGYAVGTARSERVAPQATLLAPNSVSGPFAGIEFSFSEVMDPASHNPQAVQLRNSAGVLVPVTSYSSADWRFHPTSGPLPGGEYTLSLTPQMTDLVGNPVVPRTWTFTVDATVPTVVATSPSASARYVSLQPTITVDFSEEMAAVGFPASVTMIGMHYLPIDVNVQGRRLTITPRSPLLPDTEYSVMIQPGITDMVGNGFERTFSFSFRTDPGRFDYPVARGVGSSPAAVAIGDINGDGRNDVVMTNEFYFDPATDFRLFVFTQRADGQLAAPVSLVTRADYVCRPASVQVGDLNGDGRDDVAVGELGCGIEVFLQNASGQLVSSHFLNSPASYIVLIRDMNGDGRLDLVGLGTSSEIAVWLQEASGNIGAPRSFSIGSSQPMDLDTGDVDGDGRTDIVVLHSSSTVTALKQQVDGSFANPTAHPFSGAPLDALAVGDINGDGRDDVVVTRWWNEPPGVLLQNANGALVAAPSLPGAGQYVSTAVEIVDINGDGRKDIVTRGESGFGVSIQQASGAPGPLQQLHSSSSAASFNPQSLAIGDINGDGRPDLVSSGITVALNRGDAMGVQAAATRTIAKNSPSLSKLTQKAKPRGGLGVGRAFAR